MYNWKTIQEFNFSNVKIKNKLYFLLKVELLNPAKDRYILSFNSSLKSKEFKTIKGYKNYLKKLNTLSNNNLINFI